MSWTAQDLEDLVATYKRHGAKDAQAAFSNLVAQKHLSLSDARRLREAFLHVVGKLPKPAAPPTRRGARGRPTFARARDDLLRALQDRGWTVTFALKVNHATDPDRRTTLFFRPQSIYQYAYRGTESLSHAAKEARSLWIDPRDTTVEALEHAAGVRARPRRVSTPELRARAAAWFARARDRARRRRRRRRR